MWRTFCWSVLVLAIAAAQEGSVSLSSSSRFRRSASPQELFRDHVTPSDGGKVPEAAHLRAELNKIDSLGLKEAQAQRMADALKDTPLPDKVSPGTYYGQGIPPSHYNSRQKDATGSNPLGIGGSELRQLLGSFDEDAFPFNPIFDSHKLSAAGDVSESNDITNDFDLPDFLPDAPVESKSKPLSNFGDVKPDLLTVDPYHKFAPSYESTSHPDPYGPVHNDPYDKPDPYKPVHNPYEDPYKPPVVHDSSYKPPVVHDSSYKPPIHDSYGPPVSYKPKGPVLLDKRPHEVTEIKSLPVSVDQTYTNFDCRKVPYPDRHYADPDAGCQIYHFCHSNGKQDTFHCPYGTIFNEYLGTCDHDEAVYCRSSEGYKQPSHRPYHPPAPHNGYGEPSGYHGVSRYRSLAPRPKYREPTGSYRQPAYPNPSALHPLEEPAYRRHPGRSPGPLGRPNPYPQLHPGFGSAFTFPQFGSSQF